MSALRKAQFEHDELLSPQVSESPQEITCEEWIYNAAEQLVRFNCDVMFKRRMQQPQGVTVKQLALAVDEHVNNRLAGCEIDSPALGLLLNAADQGYVDRDAAAELLGSSDHPLGMRGEIAAALLQPLVEEALIALAEDCEP